MSRQYGTPDFRTLCVLLDSRARRMTKIDQQVDLRYSVGALSHSWHSTNREYRILPMASDSHYAAFPQSKARRVSRHASLADNLTPAPWLSFDLLLGPKPASPSIGLAREMLPISLRRQLSTRLKIQRGSLFAI